MIERMAIPAGPGPVHEGLHMPGVFPGAANGSPEGPADAALTAPVGVAQAVTAAIDAPAIRWLREETPADAADEPGASVQGATAAPDAPRPPIAAETGDDFVFRDGPDLGAMSARAEVRGGVAEVAAGVVAPRGQGREVPDSDGAFQYGVASGDPASDSVVIWTHARPEGVRDGQRVAVTWEVATDAAFRDVVDRGLGFTSSAQDYTFKAIADGLEPGGEYHYRFKVRGEYSEAGRTRTLPDDVDALTFAVFSCANFPAGFFNAYDAAVETGFDYAIHLGDYIYEYGLGEYATENAEALGRVPSPETEVLTYADYSARYAQYHGDEDLQALRAAAPAIMMWDDHETANDSWETGAENHDPLTEGEWETRRDAALKAYFDWNPIREPESGDLRDHDKSYDFGDLATLHMLETRLQARDQTRSDTITAVTAKTGAYAADGAALVADALALGFTPREIEATLAANPAFGFEVALATLLAEAADPDREMIGADQLSELAGRIEASDATWQILGSQTLINRMELPLPLLFDQDNTFLPILAQRAAGLPLSAEQEALLATLDSAPTVPYNLDAWDGYQAEREAIARALVENGAPAIVLSGDTHNAWFSTFNTADGDLAAYQFGGPGVTSPGLEELFPQVVGPDGQPVDYVADIFVQYVQSLLYANAQDRGYMSVAVTDEAVSTDYVYVDTTQSEEYGTEIHNETVLASAFADEFDFAM